MRRLEILDGGMFTTVQDLGRREHQRFGVAVSGAMDPFAIRAANRLVGNDESAAALELTMVGPELRVSHDATVAVTGADLSPRLDGRPLGMWASALVRAGSTLTFGGLRSGMRAYLAIDGGIDVPLVLGSRSTSTRSALGGFEGRALRAGDVLTTGEARLEPGDPRRASPSPAETTTAGVLGSPGSSPANTGAACCAPTASRSAGHVRRGVPRASIPVYTHNPVVRVVLGPQDDAFTAAALATLETATYAMTAESDRIGCRFQGPPLAHRTSADIVSDGTTMGSIQVSGDGMPIVLMADRGTTGGYTKIATVISCDLPRLAQAVPGDRVRFRVVSLDEAHRLLRGEQAVLEAIDAACANGAAGVPADVYDEDAGAPLAASAWRDLAEAIDTTREKDRHGD